MADFISMVFLLHLIVFLGITISQIANLIFLGRLYDMRINSILLVCALIFWGLGLGASIWNAGFIAVDTDTDIPTGDVFMLMIMQWESVLLMLNFLVYAVMMLFITPFKIFEGMVGRRNSIKSRRLG